MELAASRLKGCKLRWTDTSAEAPDWDITSFTGSPDEFIAWAKTRTRDYEPFSPPAPQEIRKGVSTQDQPAEAGNPSQRPRPMLAVVNGNNALAPQPAHELTPEPLSEDAFAHNFAERYADEWRCVDLWGKWFHWNGDGWAEDREWKRIEPMRELVREELQGNEAQKLTPDGRRKLSRLAVIGNSVRLAGMDKRLRTTPEIWDSDPWMLGVPGGVVDLKTGKMLESSREQCITMRCSVAPKDRKPELWLKMLNYWLGSDEDVIGWLRRYCGYALTGDNREQCMAFFYGPAQAGKGTILRTLAGILGSVQGEINPFRSYHYEAPITTFMETKADRHSTELAALYGKRLITAEEPAAGAKWDEGKLKWITGGSQITARFVSRDNFSFTMTGKIIVAANHRPRLSTSDKAIRRRLHVLPFEHPVPDEDRDNQLDAKLREEWPAILHWMIEGCIEWQMSGLGLPEKIALSTDNYLESEDTLGAWLDENCERRGRTLGSELYENYKRWCDKNGESSWSRKAWSSAMNDRGFPLVKGAKGVRMVDGVELKPGANLP